MLAALASGMDTAKGLAIAWGVPMVGVHHMQAHALTPRLLSALEGRGEEIKPEFPFLTLLVSGGHTILLKSEGLTSHKILAETIDIALGDMVDKCARRILPEGTLEKRGGAVAYGAVLEEFCFEGRGEEAYDYHVVKTPERKLQDARNTEKWGDWKLSRPLTKNEKVRRLQDISFCGLGSTVDRYFDFKPGGDAAVSVEERKALGREAMMLAFEHVASRVAVVLDNMEEPARTLVMSGGVAANKFLQYLMKKYLKEKGYPDIQLIVPPQKYCTDNAAMIAWAGLEMYRDGWETDNSTTAVRKWSLDDDVYVQKEEAGDEYGVGGVLGIRGWKRRGV